MFPSTNLSRSIGQKLTFFVILGTVVWMIMLVIATTHVRSTNVSDYRVKIGPILLDKITRKATKHGHTATISMEKGLIAYFLLWLLAGSATGVISYTKSKS